MTKTSLKGVSLGCASAIDSLGFFPRNVAFGAFSLTVEQSLNI